MPDVRRISWLHLSDLHLSPRETEPRQPTRDHERCLLALEKDIRGFVANAGFEKDVGVPEVIFLSGDVVRAGADHLMFDCARRWVRRFGEACAVDAANVFVIPGNHDIDRRSMSHNDLLDLSGCDTPTFRRRVDNLWDARGTVRDLNAKFDNYHAFAEQYADVAHFDLGCWRTQIVIGGVTVDLLGVNSVWTGGDDALDKPGFPVVGQTQRDILDAARGGCERADLTVVLQHNPTSYLHPIDSLQHATWLDEQDAIVFCGHLHQAAMAERRSMHGRSLELMGGALYDGYAHERRYSIGTIELATDRRRFHIALRSSSGETETAFHRDLHRYAGARDGVAHFVQAAADANLGHQPPTRDQLEISLERAFLRYDGTKYYVRIEKRYVNPTERTWTHVDALVLVNAYPDDPLRSRELYRARPLELDEIGFAARCDGAKINWSVVHDLDSSKHLQLIVGDGTPDFPGLEPGATAILDYEFAIARELWGPYFERHIRRPTADIHCELSFPRGMVSSVTLVANRHITGRVLDAELERSDDDRWDTWSWTKNGPALHSRYRFAWSLDRRA